MGLTQLFYVNTFPSPRSFSIITYTYISSFNVQLIAHIQKQTPNLFVLTVNLHVAFYVFTLCTLN